MPGSAYKAPAEVYAKQLFSLNFGYPLWNPEPPPSEGEMLLGDVGFVKNGTFYCMFNATRPPDDPVNKDGVPEGYTAFQFRSAKSLISRPGAIQKGVLHSRTIEKTDVELSASAESR